MLVYRPESEVRSQKSEVRSRNPEPRISNAKIPPNPLDTSAISIKVAGAFKNREGIHGSGISRGIPWCAASALASDSSAGMYDGPESREGHQGRIRLAKKIARRVFIPGRRR